MSDPDSYQHAPSALENAVSAVKQVTGFNRKKPAASADASDSSSTSDTSKHESMITDGIKGLIRAHSGGSVNKSENSALEALDAGANSAPGNSADY